MIQPFEIELKRLYMYKIGGGGGGGGGGGPIYHWKYSLSASSKCLLSDKRLAMILNFILTAVLHRQQWYMERNDSILTATLTSFSRSPSFKECKNYIFKNDNIKLACNLSRNFEVLMQH